jgi:Domain of unknown function (DUF4203)
MEQILVGIALVVLGLATCFFGLRFWFYLLPIIGAAVGFYVGARLMQDLFGTGFLSTAVSWLVGIIIGIGFALLSWFVWYMGVIILAGAAGAMLASGLLHALFDNPWGWVLFIIAILGAILFAVGAIALHVPSLIVVVLSAFVGGAFIVAGVMTLFGWISLEELANGPAIAVVDEVRYQGGSWLWVIAWLVLGILGYVFQLQSIAEARMPEERWVQTPRTV